MSSPMKRSALVIIHRVYVQTFIKEEGQGDGLVTLGSYMEHIEALFVFGMNVSAMLDKESDKAHVSVVNCEMQSCEAVRVTCLPTQPVLEF